MADAFERELSGGYMGLVESGGLPLGLPVVCSGFMYHAHPCRFANYRRLVVSCPEGQATKPRAGFDAGKSLTGSY